MQTIFYDDPRVLTVSIHEGPQTLFPGTGYSTETGGPGRRGLGGQHGAARRARPTPAGSARSTPSCRQVVRAFEPEILLSQHGCDSHMDDPLTNLMLSIDGQRASYLALEQLAEELTGGRWIITGGGGYSLTSVVPRVWTHLLAIVAGAPLDPDTATTAELAGHGGGAHRTPGAAADDRRTQPWPTATGTWATTRRAGWTAPIQATRDGGVSAARDRSERLNRQIPALRP